MNDFGMGCKPPKYDIRDYKIKKKKAMAVAYPEEFEIKLNAKVKSQGVISSCVPHASSTILEHYAGEKLSTNFIYGIANRLYGSKGPGMYMRDACKIIQKYGDMKYDDCPGNTEVEVVYDIANKAFDDKEKLDRAYKYHILSYAQVKSEQDIKYAIMNYGPVFASMKYYDKNTFDRRTGILKADMTSNYGYHAIVVYGWNKFGWLCQNSWGVTWGNNGKFVLPYEHGLVEAYSIVDYKDSSDEDIVKPNTNQIIDIICKLINIIINLFKKK